MEAGSGSGAVPGRVAALNEAYELLDLAQLRPCEIAMRYAVQRAECHGWTDVQVILRYAIWAQAVLVGTDSEPHLDTMEALAAECDDVALTAIVMASRAEWAWRGHPRPGASRAADAELARAVALLDEGGGRCIHRPAAWGSPTGTRTPFALIACGSGRPARRWPSWSSTSTGSRA